MRPLGTCWPLLSLLVGPCVGGVAQHRLTYLRPLLAQKDPAHIAANFPDIDDEILSPAFTSPDTVPEGFRHGISGPTPQNVLEDWLKTLAARNHWMSYQEPDFTSEEGRSIPLVTLSSASPQSLPSIDKSNHTDSSKLRVWLTGGVHGNEPGGDQAILALLGKLDANASFASSLLDKADLMILPRYNPDGVARFQRTLANGADPNRDHTELAHQQTVDIKRLQNRFAPHVGIDCHEYYANRRHGRHADLLFAQDAMISSMKNLNVHRTIRALSQTLFVDRMGAALDARGLRWGPYVTRPNASEMVLLEMGTDTKMDTHVALGQGGHAPREQHFRRRVATGLVLLETAMEAVVEHAGVIYDTVEAARAEFIESREDIVVTDCHRMMEANWTFIDSASGGITDVPVQFGSSTPVVPEITRRRPEAYIFGPEWASVAEKLRIAGVQVDTLTAPFQGEVEAIHLHGSGDEVILQEETTPRVIANTEVIRKEVQIPAGGFLVSTRQRMVAQAFVRLEPESVDSFAAFRLLSASPGDEYPVYRVMP
uniref:Carboxypeptidase M14B n=1 Tax=Bionectria ochroleuca TaxID=29856 RepID=A0A8H7TV75_BIOOC